MSSTQNSPSSVHTQRISIEKIKPAPERHYFGRDHLDELAGRMRVHGLVDPIVVRAVGECYEIISGTKRWLAAQRLGWRSIDVRILNN